MTDENGVKSRRILFHVEAKYENAVNRVAIGNLIIQKDIEAARDEHAKLSAQLHEFHDKLDIYYETQREAVAAAKTVRSAPPPQATFLLALVAPKNSVQALLGDLEEIFQKNTERFGETRARRMYWFEVARSVGPSIWRWLTRLGVITFLVDYVRSKFGL